MYFVNFHFYPGAWYVGRTGSDTPVSPYFATKDAAERWAAENWITLR